MNIGIIGTGNMGGAIGKGWAAAGHKVLFGSRDPKKSAELAKSSGPNAKSGTYKDAVAFGDVVLLATPWHSTQDAIKAAGSFKGKILIDCTNPLLPDFAGLALGHEISAGEEIARWTPGSRVVKAFNSIGSAHIANPKFGSQNADGYYCGDDEQAKEVAAHLIKDLNLNPVDCGPLKNARLLEPLAFLWVYLAFNKGALNTAWKLIRR
ncbi:MAG TPA: NADPH-dependent F420 reductase [bacterium]|jgi:NADPH-dependent F420 reductase